MTETGPFLIAGLGNPGPGYKNNRHNIGFRVVDAFAQAFYIPIQRVELRALVGKGLINENRIILAKPQTYMNHSGRSVVPLVRFYKVPLENLIVVHDDLDLPFGTLRLRAFGGTGGQRGMESIVTELGSQNFARLRIGIGRPPGRMDPADYVLHDFDPPQDEILPELFDRAVDVIRMFIVEGIEQAMNTYNGRIVNED